MKLNQNLKQKKFKYPLISLIIIIMVVLSVLSWNFFIRENEFKVTVLNLSNKELVIMVRIFYNTTNNNIPTKSESGPKKSQGGSLHSNESTSYIFTTSSKDVYIGVETEDPYNLNSIKLVYYHYQDNELYNLLVIVQNSGENITFTKMPE